MEKLNLLDLANNTNVSQIIKEGLDAQDQKAKSNAIEKIKEFYATARNEQMLVI